MNEKVTIVTDSCACIPQDQMERYGIEVMPIQVVFGDKSYQDGIDITPAEFYSMLRQTDKIPTTAGSLPGPFLEAYRAASQRASTILCITVSAKLSGLYNSALVAKEMATESLPNLTIEVLDSETAAAAQGLVVLAAARAAAAGKSLTEVTEVARSVMPRVNLLATLDTLHYLVKGGRIPKAAALAGSLLRIKPTLTLIDGEIRPLTNPRTTKGAMKCIIKIVNQKADKGQPLHLAVMHADARDQAVKLRNQLSAQFNCNELFITEFTPVMGAHTGPGVIGVAFYSGD